MSSEAFTQIAIVPPPPLTSFATAEFYRSVGPSFYKAITTNQAGASGRKAMISALPSGYSSDFKP